ncbi:MAG: Mrp/NBP35 family ATP-binding protein [Acidaminococcaceae bacterium]|nr:Mrp/NBP35 family ATP-binding protein [Acidaminococcaceae bacterium]
MDCENCQDKSACSSCDQGPSKQDQAISEFLARVKHKYVIMSGKGGVGKSTVAADLAVLLNQQGYHVGLLDVDLHGPSIAGILGLTGIPLNAIEDKMIPYKYSENLEVMTVQGLLAQEDSALIWRGPVKIGVIRQFLADTMWSDLDYLLIDCPPGTGDEPLTIVQTIPGVEAIIVTTPQDVALADVRKSINFCQLAQVPIKGLVENMSGFVCPNCGAVHNIFKSGGGEKLAQEKGLPFLGKIPLDAQVVDADDAGDPLANLSPKVLAALTGIAAALTK